MKFLLILISMMSFTAEARPTAPSRVTSPTYSTSYFSASGFDKEFQTTFNQGSYSTRKSGTDTLSNLDVTASLAFLFRPQIQLGAEAHVYSTSGGSKTQSFVEALGFGSYNFGDNLRTAFYAKGGVGTFAIINTKSDFENKFGFMVGLGKRFPFWERLHYNPEFRLYSKGDEGTSWSLLFLNASVMF